MMTSTIFTRRHLLGIADLNVAEIEDLLARAAYFVSPDREMTKILAGRCIVNLFFENSTRTRTSFELAAKKLGADVINIESATSSLKKGESYADTLRTVAAMGIDAIVIRHPTAGAVAEAADYISCAVINAGDGQHEHPTQALLDALTIRQQKGRIEGLTIAICGDVRYSRVAHSNIIMLRKLGAHIRLVCPETLQPAETEGLTIFRDMATGLKGADVVMTQRIQLERMAEADKPNITQYQDAYRLDRARLAVAKPDAIVMNPGPINRMVELTDDVADDPKQSVILQQVRNGVAVRMAVLDRLLNRSAQQQSIDQ